FAGGKAALEVLAAGAAHQAGLLTFIGEGPMPERAAAVPLPTCLALRGGEGEWPGVIVGTGDLPEITLAASTLEAARQHAAALAAAPGRALAIRCASSAEARAAAGALAAALGRRPAFIETDRLASLAPWLVLRGLVPVFC